MNFLSAKFSWILKAKDGVSAVLQSLLSKTVILGIGLVTSILNSRFLGPDGRGEQAAMIALISFIASLATIGVPTALIYNLKRYPESQAKLLGSALLLSVGLGSIGSVIGIFVLPQWLSKYSPEVIHTAQWFMLGVPFTTLSYVCWAALEGRGEFSLVNKARPIPLFMTLGLMFAFIGFGIFVPTTSALAYFLPNLLILFWILPHLWSKVTPVLLGIKTSSQRLLSYGVRAYGIDVLSTLSGQIDQLLVVGMLSPASMGTYVVALSLSRTLNVFQESITMVLFPKVAARSVEGVLTTVGQATRLGIVTVAVVGSAAILLSPVLIKLLYGQQFLIAVPVFQVLVIEVLLSGTARVLVQAFMALERPGVVTLTQGMGLACTIPLMIYLIPLYGILGAGLSLMGSSAIRLIFVLICFPVFLRVPPPQLVLNRQDCRLILRLLKREA